MRIASIKLKVNPFCSFCRHAKDESNSGVGYSDSDSAIRVVFRGNLVDRKISCWRKRSDLCTSCTSTLAPAADAVFTDQMFTSIGKLETVSIAEPLQNRQHAQNP